MVGWYFEDRAEFGHRCRAAGDEGFRAIKLKVGLGTLREDIDRIQMARQAVGDEVRLMVDANQAFTTSTALERGKAYQDAGVFWFEEPLPPQNHDGYEELSTKLSIRMATGENEYTKYAFADLIRRGAVDIVQPDSRRAGGVTEWMEIAAMPNAIYLESGSLKGQSMYETRLSMVDGEVLAPEVPGLGTAVRDDYIARYRVR